jgi:hypothetical protein
VREANIPQLSKINDAVPRELEQIIGKALSRDQSARYMSARDFGRDLTRLLFKLGRAVNEDDVAKTVRAAMGVPNHPVDGTQKIADLIDLMLLEFKSLTKDSGAPPGMSIFPDPMDDPGPTSEGIELGGLADELEGPDPTTPEETGVAGWFRGLVR